jgi:hypothetical protein
MDYLVIGSNGFAQVGSQDFHEKNKIEMKVLGEHLRNNHPIPEEFWHICAYRVKWFNHDFGRYSEIVLVYDDYILDQWEEDNPDKFDRFWNWVNGVEGVDLESESINQAIRGDYEKTIQYQPFQK